MLLYHQSESLFAPGDLIGVGRWGSTALATGAAHPFFYREQFLELWRVAYTACPASRLTSAFAFEDVGTARAWSTSDASYCYRVEPVDAYAPSARLDMLWLTWMGEPAATFDRTASQCKSYWEGRSTAELSVNATPTWEWLLGCPLRVLERLP
jgi:hypothetical protein